MKKVIIVLIGIFVLFVIIICSLVYKNDKYYNDIEKNIIKKTDIKNINYVNGYGEYYIVRDNKYVYIFNHEYEEILKIDNILLYENKDNYDIIYDNEKVMYYHDYYEDGKLVVEYYDLYTYKLLKKIEVNG